LPALAPGTNKAEGIVIRPMNGGNNDTGRALTKLKIVEFSETEIYDNKQDRRHFKDTNNSDYEREGLYWEMLALVTEQRLEGVYSKLGRMGDTQGSRDSKVKKYTEALYNDVIEDFNLEFSQQFGQLGLDSRQRIKSKIWSKCNEMVINA